MFAQVCPAVGLPGRLAVQDLRGRGGGAPHLAVLRRPPGSTTKGYSNSDKSDDYGNGDKTMTE